MSVAFAHKLTGEPCDLKQEALSLSIAEQIQLFDAIWPHLDLYGLEFRYNEGTPTALYSRFGFRVDLVALGDGSTKLVMAQEGKSEQTKCVIAGLKAGDRLVLRYFRARGLDEFVNEHAMVGSREWLPFAGEASVGFDVQMEYGAPVRVWRPGGNGLALRLKSSLSSNALVTAVAPGQKESWLWDFPDVELEQSVTVKILNSAWFDPPTRKESHYES